MSERLMIQPIQVPDVDSMSSKISTMLEVETWIDAENNIHWRRGLRETAEDDLKMITEIFGETPDLVLNVCHTRSWGKTMIFDNGKTKEYRENRKYL